MGKYILFDTETTGNKQEDRIIQVGAMVIDLEDHVVVYDELCSTDLAIKIEAMAVHGITPDVLEGKGKFIETNFYKMLQECNTEENYLIAHNLPFDLGMLQKEGFVAKLKLIDTLRVAKHLLSEQKSKSLQYLRYALELYKNEKEEAGKYNITIKAHDAIGDVLVMKLLLSRFIEFLEKNFPNVDPMVKMEELTRTPILIEKFIFGKYKGKLIGEVCKSDRGYITWMQKNVDLDVDMSYTIDTHLGNF